jgi:hypothetical protein
LLSPKHHSTLVVGMVYGGWSCANETALRDKPLPENIHALMSK